MKAFIAQLRHIDLTLMIRIKHHQELHTRYQHAAPENTCKLWPDGLFGVEVDQCCRGGIETHQVRSAGERRWIQFGMKRLSKPGIPVVEGQSLKRPMGHVVSSQGTPVVCKTGD